MAWTDPITWVFEQALSATILNQQLKGNMEYLKSKPSDLAIVGTDQTVAVTTWTKITGSELQITLEAVSDLVFLFNFGFRHSSAGGFCAIDIYDADANVYLSSGTVTPQTNGLGEYDVVAASADNHINKAEFFEDIAAGEHNYEIWVKTSVATLTLDHDQALCYYAVWER